MFRISTTERVFFQQNFWRVVFLHCWMRVLHTLISEGKSFCNDADLPVCKRQEYGGKGADSKQKM